MNQLTIALVGLGDITQKAYLPIATQHAQLDPQGLLAAIHVNFEFEGRLFQGAMDRLSGCNEEVVEITGLNEKWRFESLTNMTSMVNGIQQSAMQNDWQATLYKRGFESMLEA